MSLSIGCNVTDEPYFITKEVWVRTLQKYLGAGSAGLTPAELRIIVDLRQLLGPEDFYAPTLQDGIF